MLLLSSLIAVSGGFFLGIPLPGIVGGSLLIQLYKELVLVGLLLNQELEEVSLGLEVEFITARSVVLGAFHHWVLLLDTLLVQMEAIHY